MDHETGRQRMFGRVSIISNEDEPSPHDVDWKGDMTLFHFIKDPLLQFASISAPFTATNGGTVLWIEECEQLSGTGFRFVSVFILPNWNAPVSMGQIWFPLLFSMGKRWLTENCFVRPFSARSTSDGPLCGIRQRGLPIHSTSSCTDVISLPGLSESGRQAVAPWISPSLSGRQPELNQCPPRRL